MQLGPRVRDVLGVLVAQLLAKEEAGKEVLRHFFELIYDLSRL